MAQAREILPDTATGGVGQTGAGWVAYVIERGLPRVCPLDRSGRFTVGRDGACDVVLADASVSRRHALLHVGPLLQIEDLASTNGTTLDGTRLQPHRRQPLRDSQSVMVGDVHLLITRAPVAAAVAPDAGEVNASPESRAVYEAATRIAATPFPVLILGETGTGKDVLASYVHRKSLFARGPLVRVNCAAIAPGLLESELFGHEAGAFTGATKAKVGLMETAEGGSLFLDEIGELPLPSQAKLLHALENQRFMRVGGLHERTLHCRLICATNRDLLASAMRGEFRADLYHRISALLLTIPPLRERRSDILPLAAHFLQQAALQLGLPRAKELAEDTKAALLAHPWTGNARELRNVLVRATVTSPDAIIAPAHLGLPTGSNAPPASERPDERSRIVKALARHAGNQSRAAEDLGISRRHLIRKLDRYQIERPRAAPADAAVPVDGPDKGPP